MQLLKLDDFQFRNLALKMRHKDTERGTQTKCVYRYVQVEYGPMELDLNLRVRIHELEKHLAGQGIQGLVETSPGVRSCMIEYDQRVLPLATLLQTLLQTEQQLPKVHNLSQVLHLLMAFNERWMHSAPQKYMLLTLP